MSFSYEKEPTQTILGWNHAAWTGYEEIAKQLLTKSKENKRCVITIECYPAVRIDEIIAGLSSVLSPARIFYSEQAVKNSADIHTMVDRFLTKDRVFGYMAPYKIQDFYDLERLESMRKEISVQDEGVILIIGTGATLLAETDVLIYADLARWEIQQRYRSREFGNWLTDNVNEDILLKYKIRSK